ncbi:MAG: hypothetical protein WBY67_17880 [Pseudolabrys sp.]
MSKSLKPILFGIWGLLLTPLIATILEKWLKETFFSVPNAVTTTVFINLVALSPQRWFQFALVFFTGIVIGISLDWLARKSDENKASELRRLGSKLRSLSEIIKSRTAEVHSEWPDHVRDLKPDIVSAFISAKKIGLWVPGERAFQLSDASFLCEYLRLMGRLLEDGHFDEAKREALAWKPYLNKAKDVASNTPADKRHASRSAPCARQPNKFRRTLATALSTDVFHVFHKILTRTLRPTAAIR